MEGKILASDLVDTSTGEVLAHGNQPLTEELLQVMEEKEIREVECLVLDAPEVSPAIRDTLVLDKIEDCDEAILEIYRKMRPSSPPTPEVAGNFFP